MTIPFKLPFAIITPKKTCIFEEINDQAEYINDKAKYIDNLKKYVCQDHLRFYTESAPISQEVWDNIIKD